MSDDVIGLLDYLKIRKVALVGWSDGAIIGLVVAMKHPERVRRVFAFAANTDVFGGLNPLGMFAPLLGPFRSLERAEYVGDTGSAVGFDALSAAVRRMQLSQPSYRAEPLAAIGGPQIAIADGDHDEIIRRRHTAYLAHTIPGARLVWLPQAGHFAPLQAPDAFDAAMLEFLDERGGGNDAP
jgi:pimeloyl-ACP methyl ester carboxylesterase